MADLLGDQAAALRAAEDARRQFAVQRRIPWRARVDAVVGDIRYQSGQVSLDTLAAVRRAAATLDRLGLASYAVDEGAFYIRTATRLFKVGEAGSK